MLFDLLKNLLLLFLFYGVGLCGTLILVPGIPLYLLTTGMCNRRTRRLPRGFFVALAMPFGYIGGAMLVWSLIPSSWNLPLLTTFKAAGDAGKYGHPTEHYAEIVVLLMLTGSVLGAVAVGCATSMLLKRRARRRQASGSDAPAASPDLT